MAKKKYYAVKRGKTPGIYLTWEDCRSQISGFSGAVYKGFETLEEAGAFLQQAGGGEAQAESAFRQHVAGEILGAERAMREAVRRGVGKLTIFHDYQGIASWCLGEWKTNKEGTIAYKQYYDSLRGQIDISFQKVKGHSGDVWNDRADELARAACS